ncbi:MAG: flagellar filament capping protein FliD [Gammaproteobacteria bacterium]|nr:flagellar filament capping protein FliD [Gammaproteobacteria bacterium]
MAGSITSLGVGSGIDLEGLVNNLLAAESRPIQLLQVRQGNLDAKISAFGQLQGSLSSFQEAVSALSTSEAFREVSASSTDDSVFTATGSQSAVNGSNVVEVTQLAQNNKLGTQSFLSGSEVLGTGQLAFTVGSESFTVDITEENNTLEQIRDAINANSNNNSVQASIINVDEGSKLILTSKESGLANQIAFTVTDDDANNTDDAGLSRLVFGIQELEEAQDATLTVDGFAVTRSSNEISDVIQGVTLSLTGLGTASVSTTENLNVARSSIEALVSSYNDLVSTLSVQGETSLSGENTLLNIESRVRGLFSNSYNDSSSNINYLFQLGLNFDRDGVLSFDDEKFTEVVATDIDQIQNLFTNSENGFITSLETVIKSYTDSDGILNSRTEGLNTERSRIDDDIARKELRLEDIEARLRTRFGALDGLLSRLNSTSSFLTQQLANLPSFNQSR